MKHFFLSLLLVLLLTAAKSQTLKKVPITNTGCSLYSFCDLTFDKSYSPDSSVINIAECGVGDMSYGIICVKLSEGTENLDEAELTLIAYLNYLKSNLKITDTVGYGKGHRLKNSEKTRGVIDYWKDSEQNNWKIKGWTDGKFIGVLYGYSPKELPEAKLNAFLDGFRFPWMK